MAPSTIFLDRVSYAFSREKWAVRQITAGFKPGCLTALIGPNGSGKTTLLRLASGQLTPAEGAVTLDGRSIAHLPRRERARRIALLPQREDAPPDMTALDMVLLGRTPHLPLLAGEGTRDRALAMAAMEKTGVDMLYSRPLATLSGGELQRVAIARALCQDTPVLLLDEPVASLDIGHQAAVMALLSRLAREQDLCVACVLHDLNLTAHFADHVVLLSGGSLLAQGAPEEIFAGNLLHEAFGIGVRRLSDGHSFALTPDFNKEADRSQTV